LDSENETNDTSNKEITINRPVEVNNIQKVVYNSVEIENTEIDEVIITGENLKRKRKVKTLH